jgi:glycosyltransferase involved in cell wall biosynthesis
MKALIIDPALHSRGGHHYNATLRLNREFSRLGMECACLASSFADGDVVQELAATPCFSRSVYGRTEWTHQAFIESVAETSRQLSHAIRRLGGKPPDVVILPCCDQVLALALAKHLQRSRFVPAPRVVLWLLYAPHYKKAHDDPTVADLYGEYREAFTALRASVGDRNEIVVHCETAALAHAYREVTGLEIKVAPGANLILPGEAKGERGLGQPPTVVCIGFANEAKGYRLLPAAVERVLHAHGDVRFLIHGVVRGSDAETDRGVFDALSKLGHRVRVRNEVLTQEEYLSCLCSADLLLLPYDPEVYRSRGSGVFTEASRLGIPVIAPRGCNFAQPAFEGGWGIEIIDRSESGVTRAILEGLEQLVPLTARARAAAAGSCGGDVRSIVEAAVQRIRPTRPTRTARLLRQLFRPS